MAGNCGIVSSRLCDYARWHCGAKTFGPNVRWFCCSHLQFQAQPEPSMWLKARLHVIH